MATATNGTAASAITNSVAKLQRKNASRGLNKPSGIKTFYQPVALATGDTTLNVKSTILTFPAQDGILTSLRMKLPQLDSNATPTVKSDIILDNAAGSTVITLISQSTKGQGASGGSDELDLDLDPTLLNVNGLVLKHKAQTASATAVAGTAYFIATVNYDYITTF